MAPMKQSDATSVEDSSDVEMVTTTVATTVAAVVESVDEFLNPDDFVAISFWIISISMIAATVFFLMESTSVSAHWKTSMNVGSLVTLVAGVHYMYMREYWVQKQDSPTLYRYIDWSITVPLQMIEFYLILSAVKTVKIGVLARLFFGTVAMLMFGYMGEAELVPAVVGFSLGMVGWAFILYEIFMGEANAAAKGDDVNKYVKESFATMRIIVSAGWSIYPLGYLFGYMLGSVNSESLNVIYNFADFVNKIAFCLAIWNSARCSTLEGQKKVEPEINQKIAEEDSTGKVYGTFQA